MLKRRRAVLALLAMTAASVFVLPTSSASAGTSTVPNVCANSVTANRSQITVTTTGDDGLTTVAPAGATTTSGLTQSAAIPGAIFVAGYNLGLLVEGTNNIPANVQTKIEATNTADLDPVAPGIQNTQTTNTVGGSPPNGTVTVTTVIDDPDDVSGTGDETGTDASFSVTYNNLNWTAGASGTIEYRQESIVAPTGSPTAANNALLINALVGGVFNVQFRCAPGTVAPPDPGTVTLIDPADSFDTTLIQEPEPQRQISIDNVSVAEGNSGQTPAQFTVSLDQPSANPVTVDYATANGTATAPGDYASATGTVTFAPGDTSETVTVQVNGDTAVEPDETFDVNLSNATGNAAILDGTGVGTITNDDVAASDISINNASATEGGAVDFTVSLSAPQAAPVTVDYATTNNTAVAPGDYTAATGTVTFAPGDTSEPVSVTTIDDALVEGTETFAVNLSNAGGNAAILDGIGVGTILDNDVAEPQRQISISNASATEGGAVDFTVSLDAASANPVTVDYATANGTAVAPGDYTAATGTVTFAPGDTSETVSVTTIDDALVEGTETFDVNLSNAGGNAAIADGLGVGTILDNDVAEPQRQISINNASATEGGAVEFTVSLDAASANPVTVDYATANNTAVAPGDYTAATGTVTFAPGDTSEPVSVTTIDDALVEGTETFAVNLSNAGGNAAILDGIGVGTILDNDVAASSISISNSSATEGGAIGFTVSLSAPQAAPVTVDYATANGTAVAPGDYTAATGTVTFAPGDTSETVSVTTIDDALVEGTETFDVNLSNAGGNAAIADGLGVGTILDNDVAEPQRQISINNASATEGGAVEFTVSLDAASANPVTVDYATANNTAVAPGDYTAATGTVTFAPGDTSETVTVQTIDDTDVEGLETFVVNLTNATGNAAILDATGVGTILDNDVAEPQRKISINDVTKAEGNSGQTPFQFTVSLDAPSANPVTVDYATANGTAVAPGDYASATGTVTFAPGDTSETVTVQVNGDTAVEPNETFNVNLSNATGNATILDGTGVGTITNDDAVAGVDAAAKLLIAGKVFDLGKKDFMPYVIKVTNVGTSRITVNPRTDINARVEVNGTPNGSVAVLPIPWRLNPGQSALIPVLWIGNVRPGDSVKFIGCVNLAGDTNTANNCDSVTLIASALPHHGGH